MGDSIDEPSLVLNCRDAVEFGLERIQSFRINRFLVHARTVVIPNFLLDRAAARIIYRCLFQNFTLGHQISLIEFYEAHPLRLVSRNFRVLQPVATSVLVEVDARIDSFVDVIYAEAESGLSGLGRLGSGSRLGKTAGGRNQKTHEQKSGQAHRQPRLSRSDFRLVGLRRTRHKNVRTQKLYGGVREEYLRRPQRRPSLRVLWENFADFAVQSFDFSCKDAA